MVSQNKFKETILRINTLKPKFHPFLPKGHTPTHPKHKHLLMYDTCICIGLNPNF